jgi:hypothetical protein
VGYEVLREVTINSTVLWLVTPCSSETAGVSDEHIASIFGVEE